MNSHGLETSDWLSMKWPESDPLFSQPVYNPYIQDLETPLDGTFGYNTDWNHALLGNASNNSFNNLQSLPSGAAGPTFGNDSKRKAAPLHLDTTTKLSKTDQTFSKDSEEKDDGDPKSDSKATPQTPSTSAKNSFIPTWKSPTKHWNSNNSKSSPVTPKGQKRNKPSDTGTSLASNSSEHVRRRSQRKRPMSTKATQSYTDISTGASSPEMTHLPDVDRQDAAFKSKKSHNLTEKKYRNRLNGYFDTLLSAIPRKPGISESDGVMDTPDKKVSKGEVLILALEHIRALEKQRDVLEQEKKDLGNNLERLKSICKNLGGEEFI